MRVGAIIPSYSMTHFLPLCLKQFEWVDKVIVLNERMAWDGSERVDETENIVNELNQDNVELEKTDLRDQAKVRSYGASLMEMLNMDCVFVVDNDELIVIEDQIELAKKFVESDIDGCFLEVKAYVKGLDKVALYDVGHVACCLIKPNVRFSTIRNLGEGYNCMINKDYYLHHLKFLQPKKDVVWRKGTKTQIRDLGGIKYDQPDKRLIDFIGDYKIYKNAYEVGDKY